MSGMNAVALVGGASGNILPPGRRPLSASPSYRTYECGDGEFLFLATLFSYFFVRAVEAMGLTVALAEDVFPEDVTVMMEARFREKPRAEWLEILRIADVPAGPVGRRDDWLKSELIANNDMRAVLDDAERGPIEMPGAPVKLAQTPAAIRALVQDATPAEVAAFAAAAAPTQPAAEPAPRGGPLAGIKVLDLGTVIAGAYASAILANLGADVIQVESADGDPWRDRGIGFTAYNRGKRGLVVDLKQAAGRELFLDLARQSDVVIDNYRLGVRDRLGVGAKDVLAVNPRIVTCSITTYGSHGEETKRPGFDPLLQARSGMMAAQGGDGQEPVFHVMAVNDFATAATAAYGEVIAALKKPGSAPAPAKSMEDQPHRPERHVPVGANSPPGRARRIAKRRPRLPGRVAALDRFYACADGWILVACSRAMTRSRCGSPSAWPPRLARRVRHAGRASERRAGLAACRGLGSPGVAEGPPPRSLRPACAPLRPATATKSSPTPSSGPTTSSTRPARPLMARWSTAPMGASRAARSATLRPEPGLGEHTFEVLADYGIADERIARLAEDGVVMCLC